MPTRLTIRVIWVLVSDGQIRSEQATSQIPQPNRAMLKIVISGQFCALVMFYGQADQRGCFFVAQFVLSIGLIIT